MTASGNQNTNPQSTPTPTETGNPPTPPTGKFPILIVIFLFLILVGGAAFVFLGKSEQLTETDQQGRQTSAETVPESAKANFTASSKYTIDSDGDFIPDFIETASGTNPNKDECLDATCAKAQAQAKKTSVNLAVIIDSSGSMAGTIPGGVKIDLSKAALKKYIDKIPAETKSALLVYGHKGSNNQQDKALSCSSIEVLYPLGPIDKEVYKQKIDSFSPTGWTPIADTLLKIKNEVFSGHEGEVNRILLVSDGIETCDGDPCKIAKDLKASKIETTIDVIGLSVDDSAEQQLKCTAETTGGTYYRVNNSQELTQAFENQSAKVEDSAKTGACLATNLADYSSCRALALKKAIEYINSRIQELLDKDPTMATNPEIKKEFEALTELSSQMTQKINQSSGTKTTTTTQEQEEQLKKTQPPF